MKRIKKLTRSMKAVKGGKGKGKSLYQRKKQFLVGENKRRAELQLPVVMGMDFAVGSKPWK